MKTVVTDEHLICMLLTTVVYCGVVGFKGQYLRVGKHEFTPKAD